MMAYNDTSYTECVACSGELKGLAPGVAICDNCGGVHGHETVLAAIVDVESPMLDSDNFDGARYFDVTVDSQRIHGWFDVLTKRVMQYG